MKLTKRDILVLLYIVSVVALFLVYNFIVTPSLEEIDIIQEENAGLQSQVTTLEAKLEHQPELEKGMEKMDKEIKELVSIYPNKITEEDIILYVNELNTKLNTNATAVSFSEPSILYSVVGNSSVAKYSMSLNQITVNVDYQTDYEGFKKIVNYINEDNQHREISAATVSAVMVNPEDEEGSSSEIKDPLNADNSKEEQVITGNFTLTLFYVDGKVSDSEEVPRYNGVDTEHGNNNIFMKDN